MEELPMLMLMLTSYVFGNTIYANENGTALLECPYRAVYGQTMSWNGPPNLTRYTIGTSVNDQIPNTHRIAVIGNTNNGEYNLQISNVQTTDKGRYQCAGITVNGTNSHTYELKIASPPTSDPEVSQEPRGDVFSGNTIRLICKVYGGEPIARITWNSEQPSKEINLSTSNSAISSLNLTVDRNFHKKVYTCTASHPLWSTDKSTDITLQVIYAPDTIPTIQQSPTGYIISGNKVQLTCSVSGGNPLTMLSWNCHGSITNTTSGNTSSYSVERTVNKSDNGRICTCSTTHPITSYRVNVSHELTIYYGPQEVLLTPNTTEYSIIEGGYIPNITCNADCRPICAKTWMTPAKIEMASILKLQNINRNQTGTYRCNVSNIVSTKVSETININVQYKPSSPKGVFAFCTSTTAVIVWKSSFNGGLEQHFYIKYWSVEQKLPLHTSNISDQGETLYINFTLYNLSPGKAYSFFIVSINEYGVAHSKQLGCTTGVSSNLEACLCNDQTIFKIGIASLVIGNLIAVFTIAACLVYRFRFSNRNKGPRSSECTEVNSDGPVFTEAYEIVGQTSDSRKESRNQTAISTETYEGLQLKTPNDLHVYQSLQERGKGKAEKKTSEYANMTV